MWLWFYLQLYTYIVYPTRMGRGAERWYLSKDTMSTVQRNWIANWFGIKFGELNWIVNWIEIKYWWLNWIVNCVLCNEHLEELNWNWIQTLCLNLNWVVNPKKLNHCIFAYNICISLKFIIKGIELFYQQPWIMWTSHKMLTLFVWDYVSFSLYWNWWTNTIHHFFLANTTQ